MEKMKRRIEENSVITGKNLNLLITYLLSFFVIILLGGCFPYRVGYEPENNITKERADMYELQIKPGKTTRTEIETSLGYGKPVIDNKSWGVSVYRRTSKDGGVVLFLIYPIGYVTDEDTINLFVVYDEKGLVKDFKITYHIENSADFEAIAWDNDFNTTYDVKFPESTDGYIYDFMGDTLFASPEISEELLKSLPVKGQCTIMLTRQRQYLAPSKQTIFLSKYDVKYFIMTNVYVDNRLVMGYAPISDEGYVRLVVPPGQHLIEVRSPNDHSWSGELKKTIDCQAGQKYFLSISGTVDNSFWNTSLSGEISEVDQSSNIFHDRRAIIYINGDWLIPEKPHILTKSKPLDIPLL